MKKYLSQKLKTSLNSKVKRKDSTGSKKLKKNMINYIMIYFHHLGDLNRNYAKNFVGKQNCN